MDSDRESTPDTSMPVLEPYTPQKGLKRVNEDGAGPSEKRVREGSPTPMEEEEEEEVEGDAQEVDAVEEEEEEEEEEVDAVEDAVEDAQEAVEDAQEVVEDAQEAVEDAQEAVEEEDEDAIVYLGEVRDGEYIPAEEDEDAIVYLGEVRDGEYIPAEVEEEDVVEDITYVSDSDDDDVVEDDENLHIQTLLLDQQGGGSPVPEDDLVDGQLYVPMRHVSVDDFKYIEKHTEPITWKTPVIRAYRTIYANSFVFKNRDGEVDTRSAIMSRCTDIMIRQAICMSNSTIESGQIHVTVDHPAFTKGSCGMGFRPYAAINGDCVMNIVAKCMQSKGTEINHEGYRVKVQIIEKQFMRGTGRQNGDRPLLCDMPEVYGYVLKRGKCLLKSIGIAIKWLEYESSDAAQKTVRENAWNSVRRSLQPQEDVAVEIEGKVGLDPTLSEHDYDDLKKIALFYPQYRFVIYSKAKYKRFFHILGDLTLNNDTGVQNINLFHKDGHWDFLKPSRKVAKGWICEKCGMLTEDVNHHRNCKKMCRMCGFHDCFDADKHEWRTCVDCNRYFKNRKCFDNHRKVFRSGKSRCEQYHNCDKCGVTLSTRRYRNEPHECDANIYCRNCKTRQGKDHECFRQPPSAAQKAKKFKEQETYRLIIYDIESRIADEDAAGNSFDLPVHVPNMVAWRDICEKCVEVNGAPCDCISKTENISYASPGVTCDEDVLKKFVYMLLKDKSFDNATVLAHNGGGYDHQAVLNTMMHAFRIKPEIIMKGTRVISAIVKGWPGMNTIYLKDTMNYLPMALEHMPKAFGFPEKKKGYYPYHFNMPKNYGVVMARHPDRKYYRKEEMKNPEAFESWYSKCQNQPYDFDKELREYCDNDVDVLTEAVRRYLRICKEKVYGWNPFIIASTIASHAMHTIVYEHLEKDQIGYIPENGFPHRNQSTIALKYMVWLEKKEKIDILHAFSGGEKLITVGEKKYYVDGYVESTDEIIEINGCAVHGCPTCYDPNAANAFEVMSTNGAVYTKTMDRQKQLEDAGYKVRAIWTHEIDSELKANKEMKTFFEQNLDVGWLKPRDGMCGGRTQVTKMMLEPNDDEELKMYDFCSLYPAINMKTAYPMGQPERITKGFAPIKPDEPIPYRGIIRCDIMPPPKLHLPVLPFRNKGKLLFPLCRKCALDMDETKTCTHRKISERFLHGTWFSEEINLAIKMGYKVLRYSQVWHWDDSKWVVGGFFAKYLKPFLKMKHEASGWPEGVVTDEQKKEYVEKILETDGVELDPSKIEYNPALRLVAKLYLNTAWGKFCENPLQVESQLFDSEDDLDILNYVYEDGYTPVMLDDDDYGICMASRKKDAAVVDTKRFGNLVYGIITTARGRIWIYEPMHLVGSHNVAYCDTDSLTFVQKKGTNPLGDLIGVGLGKLTDEVPPGTRMTKFVAIAPKCYTCEFEDVTTKALRYKVKAKGLTLSQKNSKIVTMKTMMKMVLCKLAEIPAPPTFVHVRRWNRRSMFRGIETYVSKKVLRVVMDKMQINSDGSLIPYGLTDMVIDNDYVL